MLAGVAFRCIPPSRGRPQQATKGRNGQIGEGRKCEAELASVTLRLFPPSRPQRATKGHNKLQSTKSARSASVRKCWCIAKNLSACTSDRWLSDSHNAIKLDLTEKVFEEPDPKVWVARTATKRRWNVSPSRRAGAIPILPTFGVT
jgi:hypothetical protein